MIKLVLLILFLCYEGNSSILKAEYSLKNVTILNSAITFAEVSVDFDSEVYVPTQICPPSNCSLTINPACLPCNYAIRNKTQCLSGLCNSACANIGCDSTNINEPFKPLKLGETQKLSYRLTPDPLNDRTTEQIFYFRYFHNDTCKGFRINIIPNRGDFYSLLLFMARSGSNIQFRGMYAASTPFANKLTAPNAVVQGEDIIICPSDLLYAVGTYELRIYINNQKSVASGFTDIDIDISVNTFDVTSAVSSRGPCQNATSSHTCLTENVRVSRTFTSMNQYHYFSYQFQGCKTVSVYAEAGLRDIILFVSVNDNNKMPNANKYDYMSNIGVAMAETLYFSVCSDTPSSNKTIYISTYSPLDPFQGPSYSYVILLSDRTDAALMVPLYNERSSKLWRHLSNSISLTLPKLNTTLTCNGYRCENFFFGSNYAPQPYFPLPNIMFNTLDISMNDLWLFLNEEETRTYFSQYGDPKKVYFYLIMDYQKDGKTYTNFKPEHLEGAIVNVHGILHNVNGNHNLGSVTLKQRSPVKCDYEAFKELTKVLKDTINSIDYDKNQAENIFSTKYFAESLQATDVYQSCSIALKDFSGNYEKKKSDCKYLTSDPRFQADPCCDTVLQWSQPCNSSFTYTSSDMATIKTENLCGSPDCVKSFIEDYVRASSVSSCANSVAEFTERVRNIRLYFRECMTKVYGYNEGYNNLLDNLDDGVGTKKCYTDHDCTPGKCNLFTGFCYVKRSELDYKFTECVMDSFELSDLRLLQIQFNTTDPRKNYTQFIWDLLSVESSTGISAYDEFCAIPGDYPGWDVGDVDGVHVVTKVYEDYRITFPSGDGQLGPFVVSESTSNLPPLQGAYYNGFLYTTGYNGYPCDKYSCIIDYVVCNDWLDEGGVTDPQWYDYCLDYCQSKANYAENVCMLCHEDRYCTMIPEITNQNACESATICVEPKRGVSVDPIPYRLNVNKTTCESEFKCTKKCPKCYNNGNVGVCYRVIPQASCNGTWNAAEGICTYVAANSVACKSLSSSNIWEDCNLDLENCMYCQNEYDDCPVRQSILQCKVNVNNECTQQECLNRGECLGQDFLNRMYYPGVFQKYIDDWNYIAYPLHYGGCLVEFIDGVQCPNEDPDSVDEVIGNKCFTLAYKTRSTCESAGGTWTLPAKNASECESFQACYEPIRETSFNKIYQKFMSYAYSTKSKQDCTTAYANWKQMFSWEPARWVKSSYRGATLEWRSPEPVLRQTTEKKLNIDRLYRLFDFVSPLWLVSSNPYPLALQAKSELQCKYLLPTQAMSIIACDCYSGSLDADCFADSEIIPLATGQVCSFSSSNLSTGYSTVYFGDDSVTAGECALVTASVISGSWFKDTSVSLASSFANFNIGNKYAVKNKDGKIVGNILGDGVQISSDANMKKYKLCISEQSEFVTEKKSIYDVYDFGTTTTDLDKVTPLELDVEDMDGEYCVDITHTEGKIYFPIVRLKDFATENIQYFSSSTLAMLYTLAVLFLVISVISALLLGHILYQYFAHGSRLKIQQILMVLFLLLFVLIRCIYFFLIPEGISSITLDYVLVVLPTFFYFTSFTQIVVSWAVITSAQLTSLASKATTMINTIILIINIIIYGVFIIIVILFDVLNKKSPEECGARYIEDPDNSNRRAVSLAYAIIIAFFSFLIGIGALIYGNKLVKQINSTKKSLGTSAQNTIKTSILTWFSAIGFLLHCIFIIIQVSLSDAVIIFNFIAIVITEIVPSALIIITQISTQTSQKKVLAVKGSSMTDASSTTTATSTATSTSSSKTSNTQSQSQSNNYEMEEDL